MKHTEEQIIAKAKQVMRDIDEEFNFPDSYFENCINGASFTQDDKIIAGEMKGEKIPTWDVSIKSIADNIDFITFSDETGEPILYQNFNTYIFDIKKNAKGKYYMVLE